MQNDRLPGRSRLMLCGQCSDNSCNAQANAGRFCRLLSRVRKDDAMNKPECLKRAAECTRLAETTSDPDMKLYLMKLALSWMQAATEAEHKVPEAA